MHCYMLRLLFDKLLDLLRPLGDGFIRIFSEEHLVHNFLRKTTPVLFNNWLINALLYVEVALR